MLPSILSLWRARRGRRAAVAAISPLVQRSRSRLTELPEDIWLDPYIVGFVVMLITLIAKRNAGPLDTQALGLVQCEAWSQITGTDAALLGEQVIHLSIGGDQAFTLGCQNAIAFDRSLQGFPPVGADGQEGLHYALGEQTSFLEWHHGGQDQLAENCHSLALWGEYFDRRLTSTAAIG